MRPSRYLVLSDSPLTDGDSRSIRVILHSATGQVYVLGEQLLQSILEDCASLPAPVIEELAGAGLLVDDDCDEFSVLVNQNIAATRDISRRAFVLMPSAYCNMGCGYCGQKHVKLPQPAEHRRAVTGRILHAVREATTREVAVNWFGAEPMMGYAQILDISSVVIPECDRHDVRYSSKMVTNGALLTVDKIRRLHLDCRVRSFEITLDGPAATHDTQRPLKNGRTSFERIVTTIQRACHDDTMPDLRFTVRTNISRDNQDSHHAFAAAMRAAGLAHPKVSFYTALVRPWGNDVSDYAVSPDLVIDVERQWLQAYLANGLNARLLPIDRVTTTCVAVTRAAEVIDPTGNVHSCTEQPLVPGRERTSLGHVTNLQTPQLRPAGAYDTWNQQLLGPTHTTCPTCSIFPICGGSCPLVWHEGQPACPSIKTTLPIRLTLYGTSIGLQTPTSHQRRATHPIGDPAQGYCTPGALVTASMRPERRRPTRLARTCTTPARCGSGARHPAPSDLIICPQQPHRARGHVHHG